MSEKNIIDLETRLAFMEDTLQSLNKIVYKQQQQIDQLSNRFNAMHTHISEIQESMDGSQGQHEIPPHY